MRGALLEKWFVRKLMMKGEKLAHYINLSDFPTQATQDVHKIPQREITFPHIFASISFSKVPSQNSHYFSVLYQPEDSNHSYWDFIVHTPKKDQDGSKHLLLFLQVSTQPLHKHDNLNPKKFQIDSSFAKTSL